MSKKLPKLPASWYKPLWTKREGWFFVAGLVFGLIWLTSFASPFISKFCK